MLPLRRACRSGRRCEIGLQGAYFKTAGPVSFDPERYRERTCDSGVIGDLVQEGCPAQRTAVGKRARPLGGVDEELDLAVFDRVDDVRPAFEHLVDLAAGDPYGSEITLRAAGGDNPESQTFQA